MRLVILILFFGLVSEIRSQSSRAQLAEDNLLQIWSNKVHRGSALIGIPPEEGGVIGSQYLMDEWMPGVVAIVDESDLEMNAMKYNIASQTLIVGGDRSTSRGLKNEYVDYFIIVDVGTGKRKFINVETEERQHYGLTGYLEVLYEQDGLSLLKRHFVYVKKPTYVEGLDVGTRDHELLKKNELILASRDTAILVTENIKRNRQRLIHFDALNMSFAKSGLDKLKSESDYLKLLSFHNSYGTN